MLRLINCETVTDIYITSEHEVDFLAWQLSPFGDMESIRVCELFARLGPTTISTTTTNNNNNNLLLLISVAGSQPWPRKVLVILP